MFDILKELKKQDADRIKNLCSGLSTTKEPATIPEEAKFKFKISSESVDRDGEILKADGADFKWYKKNPIVLANHWYSVENIIGKTTKIWQEGTDTYAEGYFSQTNPKAKLIQDLYNEGMVKVVSVGFMVKERDAKDRNIITKWEMLEFSICAVQSNRDAESMDGKQKELMKKGIEAGLLNEESPQKVKKIAKSENIDTMEEQIKGLLESFEGLKGNVSDKLDSLESLLKNLVDDKAKKEAEALAKAQSLKSTAQVAVNGLSAFLAKSKRL